MMIRLLWLLLLATPWWNRLAAQQVPYDTVGKASYYGKEFHGRKTANGQIYSINKYTCAHRTLPFGTRLKVTNLSNGKWCEVVVNDRGPYIKGRIVDLSKIVAHDLGFYNDGITTVRLEQITEANECVLVHKHDTVVPQPFPAAWRGRWCGTLEVFNAQHKIMRVPMQLIVQPTLDSSRWQWNIVYDTAVRDYELIIGGDPAGPAFSIDEKNGIVLPVTLMGNALISSFDVQGNRIDAMYRLRDNEIEFTVLSVQSEHVIQTGMGTEASPRVNTFAPTGYQCAVLTRRK